MIPIVKITQNTLPKVWEELVLSTLVNGILVPTEYDQNAIEVISVASIEHPFTQPMLHKDAMPAGIEDLIEYTYEVVHGIKDDLIGSSDTAWQYSYHSRLFDYNPEWDIDDTKYSTNQIDAIIDKLVKSSCTKRAQAIIWIPNVDLSITSPPCLQRLFFRLIESNTDSNILFLNMNSHWRSRDLAGAWFMNTFALVHLQQLVVNKLNNELKNNEKRQHIIIGKYVDFCDSLHIYEKDIERIIDVATKIVSAKATNNYRYWSTKEEPIATIIEEATQEITEKYSIDKPIYIGG